MEDFSPQDLDPIFWWIADETSQPHLQDGDAIALMDGQVLLSKNVREYMAFPEALPEDKLNRLTTHLKEKYKIP